MIRFIIIETKICTIQCLIIQDTFFPNLQHGSFNNSTTIIFPPLLILQISFSIQIFFTCFVTSSFPVETSHHFVSLLPLRHSPIEIASCSYLWAIVSWCFISLLPPADQLKSLPLVVHETWAWWQSTHNGDLLLYYLPNALISLNADVGPVLSVIDLACCWTRLIYPARGTSLWGGRHWACSITTAEDLLRRSEGKQKMYKSSGQKQKYILPLILILVLYKSMCFHTATYRSFLSFCDRDWRQRSIPWGPFWQIEWREYNLLFLEGLPWQWLQKSGNFRSWHNQINFEGGGTSQVF